MKKHIHILKIVIVNFLGVFVPGFKASNDKGIGKNSVILLVKNLAIFLFFLFACTQVYAQTSVSGTYTGDSTWTKAKSPYQLTGAVIIAQGATLTIEPGVEVQFTAVSNGGRYLDVKGALIAKGKADSIITFKGDPAGIDSYPYHNVSGPVTFENSDPSISSILQFIDITGLGYGGGLVNDNMAALDIKSGSVSITNCTIEGTRGVGVLFESNDTNAITNNVLKNNSIAGLKFNGTGPLVSSNTFLNNPYDVETGLDNLSTIQTNTTLNTIGLTAYISVTKSDTMANSTPTYILLAPITIPTGKTLTIQPSITFQFPAVSNGGRLLNVQGTLIANGTADSIIAFKGDPSGIDSYPYHNVSGPVILENSNASILQFVDITGLGYGGGLVNDNTAAIDIKSGFVSVTNCTIENTRGVGLLFEANDTNAVTNNVFKNNSIAGLKFNGTGPVVSSNTFFNNPYDVETGLDNLDKIQNNTTLNTIGLTSDIPVNKSDVMANSTPTYVLLAPITIPTGKTLTIQPSITFQFPAISNGGRFLDVKGTLIANGKTTDSTITFKGDISGIDSYPYHNVSGPVILENSNPSISSILQFVDITGLGYGGGLVNDNTAAIDIKSGSVSVTNCTIENTRGTGVLFESNDTNAITNNVLKNNTIAGLKFNGTGPVVTSNTFFNNPYDVETGLDNLDKVQNNTTLNTIGLTSNILVNKSNVMANSTPTYVLLAPITIPTGKTLTIQPSITFQFPAVSNGGRLLDVQGTLIAKGTADSIITFKGDLSGIDSYPYHNVSGPVILENSNASILQFADMTGLGYGGGLVNDNTAALDIKSGSVSVTNCTIENTRGTGLWFEQYSAKTISNNHFNNNRIGIKFSNISPLFDNNRFNVNTYLDVVTGLDNLYKVPQTNDRANIGLTADITVARNDTLTGYNYEYVLLESNVVPSGKTLTMQPGVNLMFPAISNGGLTLTIKGRLIAKGTVDNYIYIKGDGATIDAYPYHNVSGPIYIDKSTLNDTSVMQYVDVENLGYGGGLVNDNSAAINISSDLCSIDNCIIKYTRGTAVAMLNASASIGGSCITNNRGGIFSTGGNAKIFHSNINDNTSFGVKNISTISGDIIDSRYCWWGDPSGPLQTTSNPNANGNSVSDKVLYDPWETNSPFDCSDNTILPVTLVDFKVSLLNGTADCIWQTASEINTNYFNIQRGTDAAHFDNIGKVYAAGNSSILQNYKFMDHKPIAGINYYRLLMVDKDGKFTYSKVVAINVSIKESFSMYPNPVKDELFLQLQNDKAGKVNVQVVDMLGKVLYQQTQQVTAGITSLSIVTSALSKGIYIVKITGDVTNQQRTFMKE